MVFYSEHYYSHFDKVLKKLSLTNKDKRILLEDIDKILEDPYHKAEQHKESKKLTLWRRWVCGAKYRIFYEIRRDVKEIHFYTIRLKNEKTYKFRIL